MLENFHEYFLYSTCAIACLAVISMFIVKCLKNNKRELPLEIELRQSNRVDLELGNSGK